MLLYNLQDGDSHLYLEWQKLINFIIKLDPNSTQNLHGLEHAKESIESAIGVNFKDVRVLKSLLALSLCYPTSIKGLFYVVIKDRKTREIKGQNFWVISPGDLQKAIDKANVEFP